MIPTTDESHNVGIPGPGRVPTLCDSSIVGIIYLPTQSRGQHYSFVSGNIMYSVILLRILSTENSWGDALSSNSLGFF